MELEINLPEKAGFLLSEKARYKVIYGGRGRGASWSFVRALLIRGMEKKQRFLCGRELQKSIKDSVHQLISDQIVLLGMQDHYTVLNTEIRGRYGTQFGFAGLRHNSQEIKSYEGADIAYIEEAQLVSKKSWDILTPTIRREDSEIWVNFNPELEDDETYKRFVLRPPTDSIVVQMTYRDNPWFPEVLKQDMEDCRKRSEDDYLHIWEGHCKQILEGAIYAEELRKAKLENRITDIHYDSSKPVHTFWDLGWNSLTGKTAVVMAQSINNQYRVIDYHEDAQHTVQWHVAELQKRGYVWGTDHLPHDADSTNLAAGGKTVKRLMLDLGRKVKVLPRRPIEEGHLAARTIFPQCWFDRTKASDLLQCLNRYRYEIDEKTGLRSRKPEEGPYRHGADAFRYMGMAIKDETQPEKKDEPEMREYQGAHAWLS